MHGLLNLRRTRQIFGRAVQSERRYIWLLFLTLVLAACGRNEGPPRNAAVVNVTANTELTAWLAESIALFNDAQAETADGNPVFVQLTPQESGQAIVNMSESQELPALWLPDSPVWTGVLAEQGVNNFQADCVSTAQSPLVIGMWRPVAEALGWPGRSLGWLDVGSLAADPSAWAYYSGGQFGPTLRIGHTHPGLSDSGASTLLAIVQAAQSQADAVSAGEIEQPIVQASVSAFENAVSWFGADTDTLGRTMSERGAAHLGAAVMYESTVVRYGQNGAEGYDIIPVYPFEGTFMATFPACINSAADAETQEAATLFRDFLLSVESQQRAMNHGLRPVSSQVIVGPPLDASRGVDLTQPAIVFGAPSAQTIYAVQDLWQAARKDVNLVMLLDVSGSMEGSKIEGMRAAAVQFVEQMGDEDFLTIIGFSDEPYLYMDRKMVADGREEMISTINAMQANGGTALYDAVGAGAYMINESTSSSAANAMVLLTDGLDTNSIRFTFDDNLLAAATANDTAVFTIAYGDDADSDILRDLATRANGNFYQGDEANIAAIYQDLSAAFGGSLGIGR
ncbi:MAG: VWA domain-containing protein [Caldilineaceae bacterium]